MFHFVILAAGLFLVSVSASFAEPPKESPAEYRIEVKLTEREVDNEVATLACPTLIIMDRQTATIQVGEQRDVIIEEGETVTLGAGVKMRFTPYRLKNGKLKMELDVHVAEHVNEQATATFGIRAITNVIPGKSVSLGIAPDAKYRVSFKVSQVIEDARDCGAPKVHQQVPFNPLKTPVEQHR